MKVTIKAGSADFLTFVVDKEEATITDKAIQLPVRRTNGSALVAREWLPLSQIRYSENFSTISVNIPRWLFDKKVRSGCTIK